MLFLITYESAHWCGASDTKVVVHADSEDEALSKADVHMEEEMRELFSGEYDEEEMSDESAYSVDCVEEFSPGHEEWKWFIDPSQSSFYPVIK